MRAGKERTGEGMRQSSSGIGNAGSKDRRMGDEGRSGRTLTGAGGPGPSASPPLLSLEEPGLKRGPGEVTGPTPQSPAGLGLCTG